MTDFAKFARACETLSKTSKRLTKVAVLAEFLTSLDDSERTNACLLLLGKPFPDIDPRTLDVSWRTLQKIMASAKGAGAPKKALTISAVAASFARIAETSGKGSRKTIADYLEQLFGLASELEQKYLVRIIFGEMRIGVAEGILMESVAKAAEVPLDLVRRANMFIGHPGEVANLAFKQGEIGLSEVRLQLFHPVQPMLAELAEEISKVVYEHGGITSLEFKLDGARVQIHKRGQEIKIYSRHLTDVTASLPDLIELVKNEIHADEVIVEGEVVAVNEHGRPLPFQELMRRFRRVHDIEAQMKEVPVKLYLFDLLYSDGKPFVDEPYDKRIRMLESVNGSQTLLQRLVTGHEAEAERFLQKALDDGHEGLMAKRLDSDYVPGARGKKWFKIKPAETLDLVVIAADWGSGRRVGWLSNYHLAARDAQSGDYFDLGKTFKGLTDAQFKWMTERLLSLKVRETSYTVFVKPAVVVEVAYNEIQRSPNYNSGFALRFARIKRIREDKTPEQSDTIERVRDLFDLQFKRKGRRADVAKFK